MGEEMSRTISEVTISNKTEEEVINNIYKWFEKNGFAILSLNSDGSELKFGGIKINPEIGKLIAINYKETGIIAFELNLNSDNNHTIVHCEYYVAGWGPLGARKELEVNDEAIWGRWPRRRGFKLKTEFEEFLKSL